MAELTANLTDPQVNFFRPQSGVLDKSTSQLIDAASTTIASVGEIRETAAQTEGLSLLGEAAQQRDVQNTLQAEKEAKLQEEFLDNPAQGQRILSDFARLRLLGEQGDRTAGIRVRTLTRKLIAEHPAARAAILAIAGVEDSGAGTGGTDSFTKAFESLQLTAVEAGVSISTVVQVRNEELNAASLKARADAALAEGKLNFNARFEHFSATKTVLVNRVMTGVNAVLQDPAATQQEAKEAGVKLQSLIDTTIQEETALLFSEMRANGEAYSPTQTTALLEQLEGARAILAPLQEATKFDNWAKRQRQYITDINKQTEQIGLAEVYRRVPFQATLRALYGEGAGAIIAKISLGVEAWRKGGQTSLAAAAAQSGAVRESLAQLRIAGIDPATVFGVLGAVADGNIPINEVPADLKTPVAIGSVSIAGQRFTEEEAKRAQLNNTLSIMSSDSPNSMNQLLSNSIMSNIRNTPTLKDGVVNNAASAAVLLLPDLLESVRSAGMQIEYNSVEPIRTPIQGETGFTPATAFQTVGIPSNVALLSANAIHALNVWYTLIGQINGPEAAAKFGALMADRLDSRRLPFKISELENDNRVLEDNLKRAVSAARVITRVDGIAVAGEAREKQLAGTETRVKTLKEATRTMLIENNATIADLKKGRSDGISLPVDFELVE